jgi:hypothetical protein
MTFQIGSKKYTEVNGAIFSDNVYVAEIDNFSYRDEMIAHIEKIAEKEIDTSRTIQELLDEVLTDVRYFVYTFNGEQVWQQAPKGTDTLDPSFIKAKFEDPQMAMMGLTSIALWEVGEQAYEGMQLTQCLDSTTLRNLKSINHVKFVGEWEYILVDGETKIVNRNSYPYKGNRK